MEIDLQEELKKTERLGSCEVCSTNPAKYTCPRCEIKTCSLKCSKIHKNELECDGARDRTKYKPLKQMTTMDFMNDYYFLEETTRFTKEIKNNKVIKCPNRLKYKHQKLKSEALIRKVKFYLVTNGLTKRMRNRSTVVGREKTSIIWHVEFVFPNANNFTLQKTFDENLKIHEILKTLLDDETNEAREKQLSFYRADPSKLRVLLKAEGIKKCNNRFYELNMKKSLKANLVNKVVIEFPTVHVLMDHAADDFDIIQSDDEALDAELTTFRKTIYEEVFSKKVGVNPPLILQPEEIPIIAEIDNDKEHGNRKPVDQPREPLQARKASRAATNSNIDSDDEVQPANYLFSSEC